MPDVFAQELDRLLVFFTVLCRVEIVLRDPFRQFLQMIGLTSRQLSGFNEFLQFGIHAERRNYDEGPDSRVEIGPLSTSHARHPRRADDLHSTVAHGERSRSDQRHDQDLKRRFGVAARWRKWNHLRGVHEYLVLGGIPRGRLHRAGDRPGDVQAARTRAKHAGRDPTQLDLDRAFARFQFPGLENQRRRRRSRFSYRLHHRIFAQRR